MEQTNYLNFAEFFRAYFRAQTTDSLLIIQQDWDDSFDAKYTHDFTESVAVCNMLHAAATEFGMHSRICSYTPTALRNGENPPAEFVSTILNSLNETIIIMPTVFSLSHTQFRKDLSAKNVKIATIPGAKRYMFAQNGPMTPDSKMQDLTTQYAQQLRSHKFAKVTAHNTDITFELQSNLVHESDGLLLESDAFHNLPGAESYCVPKSANGFFTIQPGWGGDFAVSVPTTFFVENGFITRVESSNIPELTHIREHLAPQNWNKIAELGIGTNPSITFSQIAPHGWSTLLGEKIYGTIHIAHGNSFAMGGDNDVPIHIDWVIADAHIEFCN